MFFCLYQNFSNISVRFREYESAYFIVYTPVSVALK
nr:MAG TPA: hypothetical protein [Caudoviricetes sp.]